MKQVYVYQTAYYCDDIKDYIDMRNFRTFCRKITKKYVEEFPRSVVDDNYIDIKRDMLGNKQFNIRLRPDVKVLMNDVYSRKVAAVLLIMYAYKN